MRRRPSTIALRRKIPPSYSTVQEGLPSPLNIASYENSSVTDYPPAVLSAVALGMFPHPVAWVAISWNVTAIVHEGGPEPVVAAANAIIEVPPNAVTDHRAKDCRDEVATAEMAVRLPMEVACSSKVDRTLAA